jgi:hypothetical protein
MRIKLLPVLAILLLAGCSFTPSYQHPELINPQSENDIEEWETLHGARVDTFFMDFYFGMSRTEYYRTLNELIENGRLSGTINIPRYSFNLSAWEELSFRILQPDLLDNKLVKMTMVAEKEILFIDFQKIYEEKYGQPHVTFNGALTPGEFFKIYKGNMLISARENKSDIWLSYEDYALSDLALKQYFDEVTKSNKEKENQTLEDI